MFEKLALVSMLAGAGCGLVRGAPLETEDVTIGPPPIPRSSLDTVYGQSGGLLAPVTPDGKPLPSGDPLLAEAERFYAAAQAPLTLDDWKHRFAFLAPDPMEDRQAYRDRAGVAVYYNRNELGLGRELGCARFVDSQAPDGTEIDGVACYVTNHGTGFRQGQAALQAALAGADVRNTVAITYRPTMDAGYQVQFYVYGPDGARADWARLDTLGPRPHPHVCMTCHGGGYDSARHLAKNAHFLPLDPSVVVFADPGTAPEGATRAGQEERIRKVNVMALETPLTDAQRELVANLYPDGVQNAAARATGDGVPSAWKASDVDRDFYRAVVKPYCGTCHLAGQQQLGSTDTPAYAMFGSPGAFRAAPLEPFVCGTFSMPNAQPTSLAFWDTAAGDVSVDGQTFPTAADAFLARRGLTRSTCANLTAVTGCSRAPDTLCGGDVSGGAVCDTSSDRCVPTSTSAGP